jgi:uncharacterized protein
MKTLLIAGLLLLPVAVTAQQTPDQPRTLTVSATGTVEREPERGVILLAVESEASNAQAASAANAEKMTQLVATLRRAGVAERNIRTQSYELRPEYARQAPGGEAPRIAGYRAINMVQVTIDTVARLGPVIDAAIGSGANRVANISFQLREPRSAYSEALAMAMRNARSEAEAVAEAAGERLGSPLNIHTGGYSAPPPPMPMRAMAMDMESMASTPIEGGTLSVTAHVTVVYRLID